MTLNYNYPKKDMEFLSEAIIEMKNIKRILAWTYVYNFYSKNKIVEANLKAENQCQLELLCD